MVLHNNWALMQSKRSLTLVYALMLLYSPLISWAFWIENEIGSINIFF